MGPDDENTDEAVDLDAVKGLLNECFSKELERQFNYLVQAFPDLKNAESEAKDEDQIQQLKKMKSVEQFFKQYAAKVRVFDPLDRPTPNEDEDAATKQAQMV